MSQKTNNEQVEKDHFTEEGEHQWVLHKDGYRVKVRRDGGNYEIMIRAEIDSDPTGEMWPSILKTVNDFYTAKRVADGQIEGADAK